MAKYISNRQQNLKLGIVSYTQDKTVLEVIGNVGIGTTNATSKLTVVGDARITGILTIGTSSIVLDGANNKIYVGSGVTISATEISIGSNIIGSGGFSGNVSSATFATNSGIATFATSSGIATFATNAGIATFATSSGIATFATNAGIATFATNAGIATFATNAGIATFATSSGIATFATNAGIATFATSSGIATFATSSGIATFATNSGIATFATSSGIATFATNAGIATFATNAGIATFATNAGIATNIIGGIASVTELNVSGITTLGVTSATNLTSQQLNVSGITTVGFITTNNIYSSGVVTATTFYGTFTGNASSATFATNAGIATNLKGGVIGNISYQSALDTTEFLTNGSSGTILQSNGVGNAPTWVTPAAAAGAITGLTIRDENNIVSGLNSVSALNFVGSIVSVASTAGIATITFLDYVSNAGIATFATSSGIATFATNAGVSTYATNAGIATNVIGGISSVTQLNVSGISTFTNGPVLIGGGTSTGTAGQVLQVTGINSSVYIGGSVGLGTTNATSKLFVVGDGYFTGILTANRIFSGQYGEFVGGSISGTSVVGTSLSISGISTLGITSATNLTSQQLNVSGITTLGVTSTTNLTSQQLNVSGISTFTNGPVLIGGGTSTGTAGQVLQVTGINSSVYIGGSVGLGTTNATSKLFVVGDVRVSGVVTATTFVGELTGTATSTTNIPNLTGVITSVGTATTLGSFTSAQLATALTDETGSGSAVFATSPTLVTPALGAATATSIVVGSGVTINASGINAAAGIITATQLSTGASGTGININTDTISGPATLTIDPAAVGDNTGAVRIKGDLYVDGTQFIVNSTTIEFADFNVGIATTVGTNALLDGAGIGIGSTGIRKTINWNNSASALTSSEDWNLVTGKQYEINGTSVLSNTTLGSSVVNSSLTSVGTLGSLSVGNVYSTGIITATSFSGNASSSTFATNAGIATNLKGGVIGNIPYQSAADTTAFLTNGSSGTILQSNGVGNAPTWVTPAAADAITGLTIRDEGNIVGGANSISTLNFVGSIVSVASTAGIATITFLDYVSNAGIATFATNAGIATYTSEWILGAVGNDDYTFTGPGFTGAESDPVLYLVRGQQYKFTNTMGAHPFRIQNIPGLIGITTYNDGIVNNGVSTGTLTWNVQFDAPGLLYYQCTAHTGMGGKIYIIDAGIGPDISINTTGIITASSFSGNASSSTFATNAGIATNLKGGVIGNIPYQSAADTTAFLTNGSPGTILQSSGDGAAPTWVTPAPAGAITGLTIRDENNIVSGLNSVSTLNFVGSIVSVASTAGIATITFLDYVSNAGIATFATNAGIATNLKGGVIGNIPYQSAADTTAFLTNGSSGTILQSSGVGAAPTWVTPAPAGAITGLTIRDEGNIVGGANSISTLNFVGSIVSVASTAGIATITFTSSDPPVGGKFDTAIDNVLYIQPTGTLDIVGVGTTTTQITTLPAGSNKYVVHSIHVTNVSNGDAEITAGFVMNARKVPASISVSVGSSGGSGIHTFTVGSASSITVGMAVTGTGNIGETTGIGSTAGFQFNTYVTSVDGNNITLSKPMSGRATGTLFFSPVSDVVSRLPVPVGSAVELLKQPMILDALDSIVLQSTGAGSGIGSASTAAITQVANSNILTVTVGAAITNFLSSGMLIQPTGNNTGIQTNTFVGVGYIPGSLSVPMTRPATVAVASTSISFTEVVVPQDGALQVTVVYQSSTDTSYKNGTGTVVGIVTLASQASSRELGITSTTPSVYYGTGNTYPSVVQSIRVSNISDGIIYPGGDYPVSVGIGNSDTIFSWLAYNMIIPKNSSIELCEAPKRLGIGQSIFASSSTPNAIEIQIAGKQKTT